jgi:hypothetical protein
MHVDVHEEPIAFDVAEVLDVEVQQADSAASVSFDVLSIFLL